MVSNKSSKRGRQITTNTYRPSIKGVAWGLVLGDTMNIMIHQYEKRIFFLLLVLEFYEPKAKRSFLWEN